MKKGKNKLPQILLIISLILIALVGSFVYIYLSTDILKSDRQLFAKYLIQNFVEINQNINIEKTKDIEEKLKENKYEQNIMISTTKVKETEPIGQIKLDIQKDNINKKTYSMLSLIMEELDDALQIEYIKENDMYSLRFTNAIKEFITMENDNLKQLAMKFGIDEKTIPDKIKFEQILLEKLKFTEDEKKAEINRYLKLLYNNISEEKYKRNKDIVIIINEKTIKTNAYILTLNMKDIRDIKIKLLETLKQDEILLEKLQIVYKMLEEYNINSIKEKFIEKVDEKIDYLNNKEIKEEENLVITVYEKNNKTLRIKIEKQNKFLTLDTDELETKKQIDINYSLMDRYNMQLYNKIRLIKENNNKINMQFNNTKGEEQNKTDLSIELIDNKNNIKANIIINRKKYQIELNSNINIVEKINYKVELDEKNNKVLNELSEEKISNILDILGRRLKTEYIDPLKNSIEIALKKSTMEEFLDKIQEGFFGIEEETQNSKL